ncbi:hypothetical protein E0H71_00220 [Rhizobium leguminosarum bv. viciae]|uniref:hypothetical protein n=1 Tax=Rhizobium leguminosarum TaxID=384 RepID=UPI00103DEB30|nr:hypothetical protein [Rhizobium leguminosarum]TCA58062.1 hypothetical protein E0H71_00220 [Rhizobium leguminosarum bv. viciae]
MTSHIETPISNLNVSASQTDPEITTIRRWWENIKWLWGELCWLFSRLPDGMKFGGILLTKSVAVSFVIGFLSMPATAIYAARFGLRVPIEGTPYIQFTLGLWSFIGFALSIAIVTVVALILLQFKIKLNNFNDYVHRLRIKVDLGVVGPSLTIVISDVVTKFLLNASHRLIKTTFLPLSIIAFGAAILTYLAVATGIVLGPGEYAPDFYVAILLSVSASLVAFSTWYAVTERPIWMLQGYLTLPLLVVMAISLFAYDTYGSLLRIIRFGGGVEVTLKLDGIQYDGQNEVAGNLLLRSSSSIFLLSSSKTILEIPSEKVSVIASNYDANWRMPDFSLWQQRKYINVE